MESVPFCLLILVACGTPPQKLAKPEPDIRPAVAKVERPAREDFPVGDSPTSLVVSGATLVWSDTAGATWSMPTTGGTPRQLSDQTAPNFAFHLFTAGTQVLATSRKDLLRLEVPDGPVTLVGVTGLADLPEDSAADDAYVYLTVFKRPEILKVPVGGGKVQKLGQVPRGVLALHGETLYVASYSTGVLVAISTAGGAPRTITRGLPRPTSVVADDTHAFVYCESDKTLRRIELTTGTTTMLAKDLVNSDDLVADGPWLYAYSWGKPAMLLRIAKDGSHPAQVIADDLASPSDIAFDADSIYVVSRDQDKIVRLAKASLPAQ